MMLPRLRGVVRRRVLVNFRVDPAVAQRILPPPFRPKLLGADAVAGVCLIRLEALRPRGIPAALGLSSENAAHRIAVEWTGAGGQVQEGVFIPRRDSGSLLNHLAGGRVFPGEHHRADFEVDDDGDRIALSARSRDGSVSIALRGRLGAALPGTSRFASLAEASAFFERGALGYSATSTPDRLDGVRLQTAHWHLDPFAVEEVRSSWFSNAVLFPPGSVAFDCALVMRDVDHEWRSAPKLRTGGVLDKAVRASE